MGEDGIDTNEHGGAPVNCIACNKPDEACRCLEYAFKDTCAWLRSNEQPVPDKPREQLAGLIDQMPGYDPKGGKVTGTEPIVRVSTTDSPVEPGRTWMDGNRWRRNAFAFRDSDWTEAAQTGKANQRADDMWSKPLTQIHVATGGGYGFMAVSAAKDCCRLCGEPLPEGNRDYCSEVCRNEVKKARERKSSPWPTVLPTFDLDSVTLAGAGKLEIRPEVWNAVDKSEPPHKPAEPQPWFLPNRTRQFTSAELLEGWTGPQEAPRWVYRNLLSPAKVSGFLMDDQEPDTRTLDERADRLVRRYGTGGTPPTPCAAFGCTVIPPNRGKGRAVYCSPACRKAAGMSDWESVFYRFPVGREFPRLEVKEVETGVWVSAC